MTTLTKNKISDILKVVVSLVILTIVLLVSCTQNDSKKISSLEKYIDICRSEIMIKTKNFESAYKRNPQKYGEQLMESLEIQKEFDSIYNSIDNDNFEFKNRLKIIIEHSQKYINQTTIKKIDFITNSGIPSLGKLELKLLLLEINSNIISELYNSVESADFKFNRITACVLPKERMIRLGDTYKATVVIAAVDTTKLPIIHYEDQSKNIKSSYGLIEIKCNKRGKFKSRGNVELVSSDNGFTRKFGFWFEYEVR